ncbi:MAG: hypothetical protein V3W20_12960, partial [Candidatus Neomarinimicrobiota bacterium]
SQLDNYYFELHLKKPLRLIIIITMFVTMIGGLLASVAKTIAHDEAKQYTRNPDFFSLPSKNIAIVAQIAAK